MANEQGLRAATDQTTSEVFVTLLAITWPNEAETAHFALNDEDILRNENGQSVTYRKSGFSYKPPGQGEAGNLIGTLRLDIVDRELVQLVKSAAANPTVIISEVLASDPDTVQVTFPAFKFFAISWDDTTMYGSIGVNDDSGEPSTSFNYTPQYAPALFAG